MSIRELRRHVGQLLIAGFDGVSASVELRAMAREFDLGGAIFFARKVESPDQVAEASYELRMLGRDEPAWVAIDREGGRVARLRAPFTEWPRERADHRLGGGAQRLVAASLGSGAGPSKTPSRMAASVTVRAIGPAVSWLWEMGTMPRRLTRPTGLMPTMR